MATRTIDITSRLNTYYNQKCQQQQKKQLGIFVPRGQPFNCTEIDTKVETKDGFKYACRSTPIESYNTPITPKDSKDNIGYPNCKASESTKTVNGKDGFTYSCRPKPNPSYKTSITSITDIPYKNCKELETKVNNGNFYCKKELKTAADKKKYNQKYSTTYTKCRKGVNDTTVAIIIILLSCLGVGSCAAGAYWYYKIRKKSGE